MWFFGYFYIFYNYNLELNFMFSGNKQHPTQIVNTVLALLKE